jgi:uncharacterized membrane protein YgcG
MKRMLYVAYALLVVVICTTMVYRDRMGQGYRSSGTSSGGVGGFGGGGGYSSGGHK